MNAALRTFRSSLVQLKEIVYDWHSPPQQWLTDGARALVTGLWESTAGRILLASSLGIGGFGMLVPELLGQNSLIDGYDSVVELIQAWAFRNEAEGEYWRTLTKQLTNP